MHTIYIFGLGPSNLTEIPQKIYETILKQDKLYLRTLEHPAAKELRNKGLNIESFDAVYEESDEDFEQVYPAIVNKLITIAEN